MRALVFILIAVSAWAQGPLRSDQSRLAQGILASDDALVSQTGLVLWMKPSTLGTVGNYISTVPNSAINGPAFTANTCCGNYYLAQITTLNGQKALAKGGATATVFSATLSGNMQGTTVAALYRRTPLNVAKGIFGWNTSGLGSNFALGSTFARPYMFLSPANSTTTSFQSKETAYSMFTTYGGDGTSSEVWRNGAKNNTYWDYPGLITGANAPAVPVVSSTFTTARFFALSDASGSFDGTINEAFYWSRKLTNREQAGLTAYIARAYPGVMQADNNVVFVGDSLTYGQGIVGVENTYPGQIAVNRSYDFHGANSGFSGRYLSQELATSPLHVFPSIRSGGLYNQRSRRNVIVLWMGTNDKAFNSQTAVQIQTSIASYVALAKAAGWQIIVCTLIPRGDDATFSTVAVPVNTYILANSFGANAVVNLNSDAAFDTFASDYNNTTYYNADKIHLKTAGAAIVAGLVNTALSSLL